MVMVSSKVGNSSDQCSSHPFTNSIRPRPQRNYPNGLQSSSPTNSHTTVFSRLRKGPDAVFYPNNLYTNHYPSNTRSASRVNMSASGNLPSSVPADGEIVPVNTVAERIRSVPRTNEVANTK